MKLYRTNRLTLLFSAALLVLGSLAVTAQTPRIYVSREQARNLVSQIENRADQFKTEIERNFNWRTTSQNREDRIMDLISDFENATDTLRVRYDRREVITGEVNEVFNTAQRINTFMARNRMSTRAENLWNMVRNDLNTLAGYYRMSWNWNQPIVGNPGGTPGGVIRFPVNDTTVRALITRIENRSDNFERQMRTALNRGRFNNTPTEDEVNRYIADFENATNRLRNQFNNRQYVTDDAAEVLRRGQVIDRFMTRNTFTRTAENQWRMLRTDLDTLARYYNVAWDWNRDYQPTPGWPGSNLGTLTGTYRLNNNMSDNVSNVVDAALRSFPAARRDNMERNLERRLASPEMIVFDVNGTMVHMATSNSQRVSFQANGVKTSEQNPRGRTVWTTASLSGNGLQVDYAGDRVNDFHVTFTPVGNRLRVTKRIYLEGRNETITVNSIYDQVSSSADWTAVNAGPIWNDDNIAINDFIVPNGTRLTARLENNLDTRASQVGDRFRMTVTSPSQYRNAVIEGRILESERSGRFLGRANLVMTFDSIQLGGRNYRFAGIINSVTDTDGDTISINNEGVLRDDSQTTRTVTRAGIGAVLGAIIGAIAGGGEGAAIGAGVGAGAGAGSVLISGRDSLEVDAGATFDITATGPRDGRVGGRN